MISTYPIFLPAISHRLSQLTWITSVELSLHSRCRTTLGHEVSDRCTWVRRWPRTVLQVIRWALQDADVESVRDIRLVENTTAELLSCRVGRIPNLALLHPRRSLAPDRHQKVSSRIWSSWLITRSSRTQLACSSSLPSQQQITSLTYSQIMWTVLCHICEVTSQYGVPFFPLIGR